jgi:hypothetical protein
MYAVHMYLDVMYGILKFSPILGFGTAFGVHSLSYARRW